MDDLSRFVDAQNGVYETVLNELRAERKTGHWMWFVFPQVRGLGQSAMAHRYGITSLAEARAYLRHSVLGPRLVECAQLLLSAKDNSAPDVLGEIDAVKLRSCMTLFTVADPNKTVFQEVLDKYFDGALDRETLTRLADND